MRAATTKSPEKDWPPAGRSAISRCQPCGSRGQLALHPDAFAQVEEHGAAAPPGHADPAAELGDEQTEEAAGGDHQDGAGGDPGRALGVRAEHDRLDDQRGGRGRVETEQAGRAQQQAARDDRQDEGGGAHQTGDSMVAQAMAGMVSSSPARAIQSEPSPRK